MQQAWFKACGLSEEVDDVAKVKICSVHFNVNDYIEPNAKLLGGRMVLKKDAVPSILVPHPQPLVFDVLLQTLSASKSATEDNTLLVTPTEALRTGSVCASTSAKTCQLTEPNAMELQSELCTGPYSANLQVNESVQQVHTPKKRRFAEPRFISEITTPDMVTPKKARRVMHLVRRIDNDKSKKIKSLQDKNRYLLKRISSLKELMKHLTKKGLMSEEARDTLMVHLHI